MVTYLRDLIQNLIGTYEPVVTTLTDGTEIVQYDIEYIVSGIIFILLIWSIFRLIGGLICSNR